MSLGHVLQVLQYSMSPSQFFKGNNVLLHGKGYLHDEVYLQCICVYIYIYVYIVV